MGKQITLVSEKRIREIKSFLRELDHTPDGTEATYMYEIIEELLDAIEGKI